MKSFDFETRVWIFWSGIGWIFVLAGLAEVIESGFYFGLVVFDRSGYFGMIAGGFVIDPWENCL